VETSDTITAGDLGLTAGDRRNEPPRRSPATTPGAATAVLPLDPRPAPRDPASEPERAAIEEALVRAGGVVAKAAALMGVSRQALYRRMERLGIVMERRPR
jgi:transcriptional regulator of acetoin/glycerol metabolism